jgi:hypothetical protein
MEGPAWLWAKHSLCRSEGYNRFHGSRVSWHYKVNYLLRDTKWYQEKVIYLLQVTHTQRIKHSPRWANCLFLIIMTCHPDTVFSLPWAIRGLAFIIPFYALLPFQCTARGRTHWQKEEYYFRWKPKTATRQRNTGSVTSQICVPKMHTASKSKKTKSALAKWSRTARYKRVQWSWFADTWEQPAHWEWYTFSTDLLLQLCSWTLQC